MNKIVQRLLTFLIGIPLVMFIVWVPFYNHLVLNIAILFASIISSIELYNMLSSKTPMLPRVLMVVFGALLPVVAYLLIIFHKNFDYINWFFIVEVLLILAIEVFSHKTFEDSNSRITAGIFEIFYAGYLFTFLIRLCQYQMSTLIICLFLFTTFICDSLAWLFGVTMGKNNKGFVAASPNKSIAGFIGGFVGAIASCLAFWYLFNVNKQFDFMDSTWWKPVLLGLASAASCIVGDLAESVLKRSSNVKDSGVIIPGRGGLLDSIDSIVFHAPVFCIVYYFLYNPVIA